MAFKLFENKMTSPPLITRADLDPFQHRIDQSQDLIKQLCERTNSDNNKNAQDVLNKVTSVFRKVTAEDSAEKENVPPINNP